jgi:hypothetical protein
VSDPVESGENGSDYRTRTRPERWLDWSMICRERYGKSSIFRWIGHAIRVRFVRVGKTVVDFVVQYEVCIDGQWRQVVRYDGSHGRPHRDILDWDGDTIAKRWSPPGTTNNQALTGAVNDIIANSDRYFAEFLKRRPWMK